MRALVRPPYRVMIKSGHTLGKTFCAALIVNWFYDTYDPGLTISTAPTQTAVEDLLWKEIRMQRLMAGLESDFIGPSAPEMKSSPDHYAKGLTANKPEGFVGRHDQNMLFVFDESSGIEPVYWRTTSSMWRPEPGKFWLAILNPITINCQAFLEERRWKEDQNRVSGWTHFSFSCLEHPNIAAELKGEKRPIEPAVSLSDVKKWINEYGCRPVEEEEVEKGNDGMPIKAYIEWPPQSNTWFKVGAEFEARCLGRWPSTQFQGLWTDSLWDFCEKLPKPKPPMDELPEIGCDVGFQGDDDTAIHVRWGNRSIYHESFNGWKSTETIGRIIELAVQYATLVNRDYYIPMGRQPTDPMGKDIPIKIDDDASGGCMGDMLMERHMNVMPVRAMQRAHDPARYPDKRSELWFNTVERARNGCISLGGLDAETLHKLRCQAMTPTSELDSSGRRAVEAKKFVKKRTGRSPDDIDALNLAYYDSCIWEAPEVLPPQERRHVMTQEHFEDLDRPILRGKMRHFLGR